LKLLPPTFRIGFSSNHVVFSLSRLGHNLTMLFVMMFVMMFAAQKVVL
jgi:hypothetical protein